MINYHPVGDHYHCCFRLLFIMSIYPKANIEWDKLKIMDFYFLFPHLIKNVQLPRISKEHKAGFNAIPEPYETLGNPKRLYFTLNDVQENAIRALTSRGIIERELFLDKSIVEIGDKKFITFLSENFRIERQDKNSWIDSFISVFASIDLLGPSGLKQRTGIAEFRYDAI